MAEQMYPGATNTPPALGISEATPSELPGVESMNLEHLTKGLGEDVNAEEMVISPDALLVALSMMADQQVFRFPKALLMQVQQGCEVGAFEIGFREVSALQSESGEPELEVKFGVSQAGRGENPETLDIKAEGTGVKHEYTWEELAELPDGALTELGTSRGEVNAMLGLDPYKTGDGSYPEPKGPLKDFPSSTPEDEGTHYSGDGCTPTHPEPGDPDEGIPNPHPPKRADRVVEVDPQLYMGD